MSQTKVYVIQDLNDEDQVSEVEVFSTVEKARNTLVSYVDDMDLTDENGDEVSMDTIESWTGETTVGLWDSEGRTVYMMYAVDLL
jgi:hypothetical protein